MNKMLPEREDHDVNPVNPENHVNPVRVFHLPELLVLLLALGTRLWGLDYHSFWFDESVSMTWARSAPEYAWDSTFHLIKDKHPPAYYLLLHYWRQMFAPFGLENNDVALRLLGVVLGVLTVLGLLLLARRLSGRGTALLAGTLAALAPALVWYSQELRMFQPAATGLVWGALCLAAACGSPRRLRRLGWWLGMVAAFTLALYSYLFAAFALPAAGLVLLQPLARWWRGRKRGINRGLLEVLIEGTVALAITGALYLPLAFNAWAANASDGAPGQPFINFWPNLQRQLQIATVWRVEWAAPWMIAALAFFALLLLAGLLLPWRRDATTPHVGVRTGQVEGQVEELPDPLITSSPRRQVTTSPPHPLTDRLFLLAWLAAPLLVGNLLLARNDTIFAEDRYFLYLAPFALWAVARGAVAIAQYVGHACSVTGLPFTRKGVERVDGERHAASVTYGEGEGAEARRHAASVTYGILAAGAVLLLAAALPRLWTPAMLREDWRAAANYIADYQDHSPGLPAAAVAHIDYTRTPLNWYLRQRYDREQLPVYFPFGGVIDPAALEEVVAPPLRGIEESGVRTLWLTQSHLDGLDDAHAVEGWLNQAWPLVTEQYPTGVKLSGFAVQSRFAELPPLGEGAVQPQAELAPGLRLAACEITTPQVAAGDERMHPPSGWVHVRLWWQAVDPQTTPIGSDYIATVRMVGPEGVWGDRLYRPNEALRRWPTSTWDHMDFVRDEVDVNLNPVTPPGSYPIVVGLMDATGAETGGTVECGRVEIE